MYPLFKVQNRFAKVLVIRNGDVDRVHTTFAICQGIAMKARPPLDKLGRPRQEIARQLLHRELIERKIAIERPDHPVAIEVGVRVKQVRLVADEEQGRVGRLEVANLLEPLVLPASIPCLKLLHGPEKLHVGRYFLYRPSYFDTDL